MKDLPLERKRALKISEIILTGRHGLIFNMGTFCSPEVDEGGRRCGTSGCIAGWTVAVYAPEVWASESDVRIENTARELLGLTNEDAKRLFYASWGLMDVDGITAEEAARTLANYALTGEVDWFTHG